MHDNNKAKTALASIITFLITVSLVIGLLFLFKLGPFESKYQDVTSVEPSDEKGVIDLSRPEEPEQKINIAITSFVRDGGGTTRAVAQAEGIKKEGFCVFTYSRPDAKPVTDQVYSKDSQCISNINDNQFEKTGNWHLSVAFYVDKYTSQASRDITFN